MIKLLTLKVKRPTPISIIVTEETMLRYLEKGQINLTRLNVQVSSRAGKVKEDLYCWGRREDDKLVTEGSWRFLFLSYVPLLPSFLSDMAGSPCDLHVHSLVTLSPSVTPWGNENEEPL